METPPATPATSAHSLSRAARGWSLVLFLIAIAAPLWHLHTINREMPTTHADLVLVTTGVRATLSGLDPYSDQVTQQIQAAYYGRPLLPTDHVKKMAYAYPAYTAIIFLPLTFFTWAKIRIAFLIAVPLLMAATIPWWLNVLNLRARPVHQTIAAAIFLISWPVMWSIRLQQPTLLISAALVLGLLLLKTDRPIGAGVLFALTTIKPQLVVPMLLWLLLWSTLQRNWRFLLSFFASTGYLLIASARITPGWIPRWHVALTGYAQYTHIHPDLQNTFGTLPGLALMIVIALASTTILWHLRHAPIASPEFGIAIALALATTVALLPTEPPMIYNDVLLLPALLILIFSKSPSYSAVTAKRVAFTFVAWNFLLVSLSALGEIIFGPSHFWDSLPFHAALLPASILLALYLPFLHSASASARLAALQPQTA